jgi:hypothetical protein
MSSKFYKCAFFSFYVGEGIRWFRLFKLKLSFKHINNYKFKVDKPKGFFLGYWLVNLS